MDSQTIIDGEFSEDEQELPVGALVQHKQLVNQQPLVLQAHTYEDVFMPSLSIEQANIRFEAMQTAVKSLLKPGIDFGQIPGTQGQCLLLGGAEKLAAYFGLSVHVYQQEAMRDRANHFWLYEHKAIVSKGGVVIAECIGECNSEEDCWKVWVKAPAPDKETAALMVMEKRGKWSEWNNVKEWNEKRDHPNPFTLLNNGNKRSQKRAYVGAVRKALGITGLFTKPL